MQDYVINKELGLIVIKYSGEVTIEQLAQLLQNVVSDTDYSISFNVLSDLCELTCDFSYDQLHELASNFPKPEKAVAGTKSALVADSDFTYGIGRVWASITENRTSEQTRVFRSMQEALEWLGLPKETEIKFPF